MAMNAMMSSTAARAGLLGTSSDIHFPCGARPPNTVVIIRAYGKRPGVTRVTRTPRLVCAGKQFWALTAASGRREDAHMRKHLAVALLVALASGAVAADEAAMSTTIIGPNSLLTEGTDALLAERWQKGVELLEEGLKSSGDTYERAAALSNLCAGYVALGDYDRALESCDESLKLDANNWKTYNNRAGALLGKGRLDEALHDVEAGLALDPMGNTLLKMEALVRTRLKHLYEPHRSPPSPRPSQS
jgi:tetratricopeptide (TPR) repeat protein